MLEPQKNDQTTRGKWIRQTLIDSGRRSSIVILQIDSPIDTTSKYFSRK